MNPRFISQLLLAASVTLAVSSAHAAMSPNGLTTNGLATNGIHLNGIHLNGIHLNGVEAAGLREGTGRSELSLAEALNGAPLVKRPAAN